MDWLYPITGYILHFDVNINDLATKYGLMVYVIMFVIIFCETGLVITPFLPGDTMIFAAAALSARDHSILNVHLIAALMSVAAFSGDVVNYSIGRFIGPKVYRKNYKFISVERLNRTKRFFKTYGVRTIIYARFIPLVRTFAPFVAGVSDMNYKRFMFFNFAGGFSWVMIYTYGGYFFGNIAFVQKHFQITILILLVLTLIPAVYAVMKTKFWKKKSR